MEKKGRKYIPFKNYALIMHGLKKDEFDELTEEQELPENDDQSVDENTYIYEDSVKLKDKICVIY